MTKRKRNQLEQNLFSSLIAYRLNQEISIIQNELNVNHNDVEEKKGLKKIIDKVIVPIKDFKDKKINEEHDIAVKNLDDYLSSLDKNIEASYDEIKINKLMSTLFYKNETLRLSFALELALMANIDDRKLLRDEKSLRALSILLFNDENKMLNLRRTYLYSYKYIHGHKYLDDFSLGTIAGTSAVALGFINPVLPILATAGIVGAYYLRKKNLKKNIDESLLMFSSLIGSGHLSIRRFNKNIFKNIDQESLTHSLASGLVMYNFSFIDKDNNESKEALSNYLQMVEDIRNDEEYMLIVEKDNNDIHHQKIEICNRTIKLLDALRNKEIKELEINKNLQPVEQK